MNDAVKFYHCFNGGWASLNSLLIYNPLHSLQLQKKVSLQLDRKKTQTRYWQLLFHSSFMCVLKVANPRGDSGEYRRYPARDSDDNQEERSYTAQQIFSELNPPRQRRAEVAQPPQMLTAYGNSSEMSAIVSALTHVVSGHRESTSDWGSYEPAGVGGETITSAFVQAARGSNAAPSSPPLSAYSSASGSGSWIGQKRGREKEPGAATPLKESLPGVYRGLNSFRSSLGDSLSSGAATGKFNHQS